MKLYLLKDKISNNIVSAFTFENLDVLKRYLISNKIDLVKNGNHSSLRLLNDCEVFEADIIFVQNKYLSLKSENIVDANGGIILKLVLDIKTFFETTDKKTGTLEDKID